MTWLFCPTFIVYLSIALEPINGFPTPVPPPYLTEEDFERGKLLPLEARLWNVSASPDYLENQSQMRANVWTSPRYKWPNAKLPYIISPKYNTNERSVIAAAIREWETQTCIRFIPADSNHVDYLELTPDDGTSNYCYSYVGRQGGRQYVKMTSPDCMSVAQYIHELGHAIGFGHEHQRPDRDSYVRINWQNINPQFYYAFDKYSELQFSTMGISYDYFSIMHYPSYAYSTSSGLPSMTPTYSHFDISRLNVRLSMNDITKTKKYYNC